MLKAIADTLKDLFGQQDTYRIGGDEFVAFVIDKDKEDISEQIGRLDAIVTDKGYHVAVGYVYHDYVRANMKKLIIDAEMMMYKDKKDG